MNVFSRYCPRQQFTIVGFWTLSVVVGILGVHELWVYLAARAPHVANALAAGLLTAFATALGTLPVMCSQILTRKVQDTLFGFGAGVMLAASVFTLIVPGIAAAAEQGYGRWASGLVVGSAMLLGGVVLYLVYRQPSASHVTQSGNGIDTDRLRGTWLFVFAIALHNLPEGLAIGVSAVGNASVQGGALALGIAIQNLPEGLIVSMALLAAGYRRHSAVAVGMLSGLLEPVGAVLGAAVIGWSAELLPWGLGFAAGAMLFVICHVIIPASHRKGHSAYSTGGLFVGVVMMLLFDVGLGAG